MGSDGLREIPPALTSSELREIQDWERTHRSPVVRKLLWEIFRLQIVARSAAQVAEHLGTHHMAPLDILLNRLRAELAELPFLKEEAERNHRILYGHGEARKPRGTNNH